MVRGFFIANLIQNITSISMPSIGTSYFNIACAISNIFQTSTDKMKTAHEIYSCGLGQNGAFVTIAQQK
jgi:hypothetical protein